MIEKRFAGIAMRQKTFVAEAIPLQAEKLTRELLFLFLPTEG